MTRKYLASIVATGILLSLIGARGNAESDPLVEVSRKIATESTTNGKAYANLRELTTIGPRLSGSEGATKAIQWARQKMESYGFDRVVLQPATVPHWTRGDVEQATANSASNHVTLKVTALGPSVGTPKQGV